MLFHHVTPTTDYLHELLTPWVHYVPVEADLSDLRENYEWAEAHPSLAMRISQAATALAMSLGTPEALRHLRRDAALKRVSQTLSRLPPELAPRRAVADMAGLEAALGELGLFSLPLSP